MLQLLLFLLCGARADKYRLNRPRTVFLDVFAKLRHRRQVVRDVLRHLRHVLLDVADKCRTARGGQKALFCQLLGFLLCDHISAQCRFDHIMESQIAQCLLDLSQLDTLELRGNRRCDNRHRVIAAVIRLLEQLDGIDNGRIVHHCAERTLEHTGAAADALVVVDFRLLHVVHLDGADLAGALTRTHVLGNRLIRTGLCTAAAVNALFRINFHLSGFGSADGALRTGLHAAVRQTAAAGVADGVPVYRTFVTGDVNDLNDAVSAVAAQRCVHALADDGAFLINAAAHGRLSARNNLKRDRIIYIFHFFVQRVLRHCTKYLILYFLDVGLKTSHARLSSSQNASLSYP